MRPFIDRVEALVASPGFASWPPIQHTSVLDMLGTAQVTVGDQVGEAVAAFQNALLERTRERGPLDWAATQTNLGGALWRLGERESGTAHLEQAVTAFQNALLEQTRERVPLDWAMAQNNLGVALLKVGERETGTAPFGVLSVPHAPCPPAPDFIQAPAGPPRETRHLARHNRCADQSWCKSVTARAHPPAP